MEKVILIIFAILLFPQTNSAQDYDTLLVAFYNLENLFDTADDPSKDDEEFLPGGSKEWTEERLDKKFYNTARVIRAMNNGSGPDILGVCEVEHQHLLDTLIIKFLNDKNYKTAYMESPDNRGIDNGLIYNADLFSLLSVTGDTVHLSDGYPTRLILKADLLFNARDTFSVFVNHWPSRRGGETESEKNRLTAAQTLKDHADSLFTVNKNLNILIIGDFNDEPTNSSLLNTLNAQPVKCDSIQSEFEDNPSGLYNISYSLYEKGEGSYKYRDDWNMLDQIIISSNLLAGNYYSYSCGSFEIFKPDFILTKSGNYEGTSFPTFGGNRYLGGYSDHFPVTAKIIYKNNYE